MVLHRLIGLNNLRESTPRHLGMRVISVSFRWGGGGGGHRKMIKNLLNFFKHGITHNDLVSLEKVSM